MYGEVSVSYSGIGGSNLESDIMPMISGSSADAENAQSRTINIQWSLPGGIQDKKNSGTSYEGGEWGYMLNGAPDGTSDFDVVKRIREEFPDCQIEDDGTLTSVEYEARIEGFINSLVYTYAGNALHGWGGSDWDRFLTYFGDGVCVHILY